MSESYNRRFGTGPIARQSPFVNLQAMPARCGRTRPFRGVRERATGVVFRRVEIDASRAHGCECRYALTSARTSTDLYPSGEPGISPAAVRAALRLCSRWWGGGTAACSGSRSPRRVEHRPEAEDQEQGRDEQVAARLGHLRHGDGQGGDQQHRGQPGDLEPMPRARSSGSLKTRCTASVVGYSSQT